MWPNVEPKYSVGMCGFCGLCSGLSGVFYPELLCSGKKVDCMLEKIFAVAIGGAIGATGRYLMGMGMLRVMGPGFPYGTLTVNVVGSLLIGLLAHVAAARYNLSPLWQVFAVTGVLGGFTTFSAFSLEVGLMIERHELQMAMIYALGSVVAGVVAMFAGLYIGRILL